MISSRQAPELGRLAEVSGLALTLKRHNCNYLIVCFGSLPQYCALMEEYLIYLPILPALRYQTLLAKPCILFYRRKQCPKS